MMKPAILLLCHRNSCRGPMAKGLFRKYAGEDTHVLSAGLTPGRAIHPLAIEVMAEIGVDISREKIHGVVKYLGLEHLQSLIVLGELDDLQTPYTWPMINDRNRIFWSIPDPRKTGGDLNARRDAFRQARNRILEHLLLWLEDQGRQERIPSRNQHPEALGMAI